MGCCPNRLHLTIGQSETQRRKEHPNHHRKQVNDGYYGNIYRFNTVHSDLVVP